MKFGFTVGALVLALFASACSNLLVRSDSKDCGFSASYGIPEPGRAAWISVSRVRSEVVDGQTKCGSGYGTTKVDRALVAGKELQLKTIGEDVVYIAPIGFDPGKQAFSIEVDGRGYIADQNSLRRVENRYVIDLRPFPPK